MELVVIILVCVALVVQIGALIRNTEAPSELIDLYRLSSMLSDFGNVKGANVSDVNKVSESSWDEPIRTNQKFSFPFLS